MSIDTSFYKNETPPEVLEQSACINDDVQWNTKQRTILIKDMMIRLTPTQYRLFTPLQLGKPVTYAELARLAYNCPLDENVRKTMDKQIDRIRTKLHGTGIYIYCVLRYGYMLLSEAPSED